MSKNIYKDKETQLLVIAARQSGLSIKEIKNRYPMYSEVTYKRFFMFIGLKSCYDRKLHSEEMSKIQKDSWVNASNDRKNKQLEHLRGLAENAIGKTPNRSDEWLLRAKAWTASDEFKTKAKNTNLKRYGVENVSQCPEIALRAARSMNEAYITTHWRTGNEIICRGSFEEFVVCYLNERRIDFDWQVALNMPNGWVYYCDLYLKGQDKYVEIKGWFREERQRQKWEWLKSTYPTSELWTLNVLKTMGYKERRKPKSKSIQ